MKIIGKNNKGFIIDIESRELEKLLGTFYCEKIPELNKTVDGLCAGDEINVASLHDMTHNLEHLCRSFLAASKEFTDSNKTMLKFAAMVLENKTPQQGGE